MSRFPFTHNDKPTIGIELELQLVDANTFALSNSIEDVLANMPAGRSQDVKHELMQSYLEINTGICHNVAEAMDDLRGKLEQLEKVTDALNLKLFWGATHPFSIWQDQRITVNDRYQRLVELMQDVARQLVTFGLHVHVGVDTGDKAVMVCDRMLRHLPLLLALSSNSPFWQGRCTGLHSSRMKVMEGLPTAGLPQQMRNYSEYVWLINHLVDTGFINTIREIWWDIRPHHNFGTVEIRVCDMPANLNQVAALTALIHCLVTTINDQIEEGTYQLEYHPMMVQQNKWRATRFGGDARLVDTDTYQQQSVQEVTNHLVELLHPQAETLHCPDELESARHLPAQTGAKQQLAIYQDSRDGAEVVKRMLIKNDWRSLPKL